MLGDKGFDLWADGYDKTVGLSDEENSYPFAGYKEILARIYRIILAKGEAAVLDIGFGTGTLTQKLYEQGCEVWGQDFSSRMMELASAKMPNAHLFQGDFSKGLVEPLLRNSYDFIIATFSLHHLTDENKIRLIQSMRNLLKKDGMILIGDVAFTNRAELERCRKEVGEEWDDEEIYFVFDELKKTFPNLIFDQVSFCAGILSLANQHL
ncbi:MAG: class I SAM-dependent methyltransferase [Lachnospiraceae bacterium]|nr:class I SAM-dependent methyltransferase [Lachnospiraceae bacterium]